MDLWIIFKGKFWTTNEWRKRLKNRKTDSSLYGKEKTALAGEGLLRCPVYGFL